jgi:hypothetical protein
MANLIIGKSIFKSSFIIIVYVALSLMEFFVIVVPGLRSFFKPLDFISVFTSIDGVSWIICVLINIACTLC